MTDQDDLIHEFPRQTAERLAAEKWPKLTPTEDYPTSNTYRHLSRDGFVSGYLAGRTVSDEQIEAGAEYLADTVYLTTDDERTWLELTEPVKEHWRDIVREAFTTASFRIEGEDHD